MSKKFFKIFDNLYRRNSKAKSFIRSSDYIPKIVIHIGAPKTGSSTIQNICILNRSLLQSFGYYYPEHDIDINGVSGGHGQLSELLFKNDLIKAKKWFDQQYKKADKNNLKLLISAEGLYQNCKGLEFVLDGRKALIIGYLRNPVEAIVSNHNQGVKRDFYTNDLIAECQRILSGDVPRFYSGRIFEDWLEAFGKNLLSIKPLYKKSLTNESLEYDFLDQLGLRSVDINEFEVPTKRVNDSYKPSALNLKRVLNLFLDKDGVVENVIIDALLQQYSDQIDEPSPSASSLLGAKLYKELFDFFEKDIAWLRSTVFDVGCQGLWELPAELSPSPLSGAVYSLEYVYKSVLEVDVKIDKYIKENIERNVTSNDLNNDLLAFIPALKRNSSSEVGVLKGYEYLLNNIDRFTNDNNQKADYLRELALTYERFGEFDLAFKLIELALKERPKGPQIIKIHTRLLNNSLNSPAVV